jgi:hypothetical protein
MSGLRTHLQEYEQITCWNGKRGDTDDPDEASRPLRIYVLLSNSHLTGPALDAAAAMAADLRAEVVLLAVREIPYPLPLDRPNFQPASYLDQLKVMAGAISCPVRIELILTREKRSALRHYLCPGSLVLIATRKHWWRTAEEKLARSLVHVGCNVSLLTMRMRKTGLVLHRLSQPAQADVKHATPGEVRHA